MSKNLRNEIVQHRQYEGGHALTKERFDDIYSGLRRIVKIVQSQLKRKVERHECAAKRERFNCT